MNDTKGLEEFQTNFTDYLEYGIYFLNDTDYADALATNSEEASSSNQRSRVCQIHLNFQFAFAGCIAGLLCIFGITGNVIAYLIFTRGRQKSAVLLMLRALAVADSLYLASYLVVQCWYQFLLYTGKSIRSMKHLFCNEKLSLADPRGARDAHPPSPSKFFIFMEFSCNFAKHSGRNPGHTQT